MGLFFSAYCPGGECESICRKFDIDFFGRVQRRRTRTYPLQATQRRPTELRRGFTSLERPPDPYVEDDGLSTTGRSEQSSR
jgi:hypothetical protein